MYKYVRELWETDGTRGPRDRTDIVTYSDLQRAKSYLRVQYSVKQLAHFWSQLLWTALAQAEVLSVGVT